MLNCRNIGVMEEKSMFSQLVKKTRSYRNFDPSVRLGPDDLARMIDLCRFTASSANKQPLKFAYAFKREDCARILPHLGWAGYLTEKPPYPGKEPAAYILICNDTAISPNCPDTDVGICDPDSQITGLIGFFRVNMDLSTRTIVFDRVGNQIQHDLLEADTVSR